MNRPFILTVLVSIFAIFMIIFSCEKKPTAPVRDNPFDPQNVQTGGDPFKLTAKIANGGILLTWNKPQLKNLEGFNIYRSEQEGTGYSKLGTITANETSYTDRDIANGHSYWYVVTAVTNDGKESSRTNLAPVNINANPVLTINGGDQYTPTRTVQLTILAATAKQMMLSNQGDFVGAQWEAYATGKNWQLPTGEGEKTVYLKVKYGNGQESQVVTAKIKPQPMNPAIVIIADTVKYTPTRNVQLKLSATGSNLKMKLSEDSTFSGVEWQPFSTNPTFQLSTGDGTKKVYAKFKNDFEIESELVFDTIEPQPMNPSITITNNEQYTPTRNVSLTLSATGSNLKMKLSEDSTFSGVEWQPFSSNPTFQLSTGDGTKKIYAKFENDFEIESKIVFDTIEPQPMNPYITIANNDQYTSTRNVSLTLSATGSNLKMKLSEDSTFSNVEWQPFSSNPTFQLSTGDGTKKVYAKFKNDFEIESSALKDDIILDTTPPTAVLTVSPDSGITNETAFQFDPTGSSDNLATAEELLVRYDYDNDGTFDTNWNRLQVTSYQFPVGGGDKTVKMQLTDGAWLVGITKTVFLNTRPQAKFTATRDPDDNYRKYYFNASASMDYEDGHNLQYRWDFDGDGTFDTNWLTQDTISHVFDNDGTYQTQLTLRDNNKLTGQKINEIQVQPPLVEMVFVHGGTFQMGDTWGDGDSNEKPVHTVTVNSFYIGKYEVTQAQYKEIMGNNPSNFKDDNRPVEEVSWYDAVNFCNKLSQREGLEPCYTINGTDVSCDFSKNGYRLPTEAEWEYAARGGNQSQGYKYSGSNTVGDVAWYRYNCSQTHDVGTKQPNELGLYDMSGNVWEWCWDWYYGNYYGSSPQNNPKGRDSGTYRVMRGGSCYNKPDYVRCSKRYYYNPGGTDGRNGFRISRTF